MNQRNYHWNSVAASEAALPLMSAVRRRLRSTAATVLAILLAATFAKAETIRLTTWNLGYTESGPLDTNRIEQAAAILKKTDPDVILLQHVRDWPLCAQLAEALKPAAYTVAICSSFAGPAAGASAPQTAVLSKSKAYFSWSEAWQGAATNGGFGFVAIQKGNRRLGIFSVQFDGNPDSARCVGQLLDQVSAIRRWEANRPQTFVVAGTFVPGKGAVAVGERTITLLKAAGFEDAFLETAGAEKVTWAAEAGATGIAADCIFAQPMVFPLDMMVVRTPVGKHYPVTCDLEIDPAEAAAAWTAHAEELERRAVARRIERQRNQAAVRTNDALTELDQVNASEPVQSPVRNWVEQARALNAWWWAAVILGFLLVLWIVRLLTKRRDTRPLQVPALLAAQSSSSYTVVIAPQSATGSAAQRLVTGNRQPAIQFENPAKTQSGAVQPTQVGPEGPRPALDPALRQTLRQDLGAWLKQKFVSKLISDRTQLLEAQQAAALKATNVDERLSRIERQIQFQTQEYERRIAELTRELLAAKEENRELIRARIAQVKAEMLAARARVLAQADPEDAARFGEMS